MAVRKPKDNEAARRHRANREAKAIRQKQVDFFIWALEEEFTASLPTPEMFNHIFNNMELRNLLRPICQN